MTLKNLLRKGRGTGHEEPPKYTELEKRKIALQRAEQLKRRITDYLEASKHIPTGMSCREKIEAQKKKILALFGATEQDWQDWKWHMRHRITDAATLAKILPLSPEEIEEIERVGKRYRWAISPYYASLLTPGDKNCPIRLQSVPDPRELEDEVGEEDPMGEAFTSPAPAITRRYPDRLIINVTNQCAMYCRHCQRRRNIGEVDRHTPLADIEAALDYIRHHEEIRDVLITGGDALMLSDSFLDWILTELDKIPHVEIKRIGTRVPVTLPMRITDNLCAVLEKHPPIYINTQFNHPKEVTAEAKAACDRLVRAGVVLGNQAVLLKGVNNDPHVMKKLNHELLKIRVRPYYIFHAKNVKGTTHFVTTIDEGLEIMEKLRGYTSGLAVPTYILNAPGGLGKTPLFPPYVISRGPDSITIRTWENRIIQYPNGLPADRRKFPVRYLRKLCFPEKCEYRNCSCPDEQE